jgi:hypothetical protein
MKCARPYLAVFLALVMVVTSQGFALARAADGPAGAMVICTGSGPVTVLVDEDGQPTGAVHICPDCALGLFAAVLPGPDELPLEGLRPVDIGAKPYGLTVRDNLTGNTRARAPPAWA